MKTKLQPRKSAQPAAAPEVGKNPARVTSSAPEPENSDASPTESAKTRGMETRGVEGPHWLTVEAQRDQYGAIWQFYGAAKQLAKPGVGHSPETIIAELRELIAAFEAGRQP